MKRKDFVKNIALGTLGVALSSKISQAAESKKKPNIILILLDDVSAVEFGCYGNIVHKTPNIDRMAQEGILFKTAWATPMCIPTRALILTAKYGPRINWYKNNIKPKLEEKNGILGRDNIIYAQLLAENQYRTGIIGKWQLPGTTKQHGFQYNCTWSDSKRFKQKDTTDSRYWHPTILENGKVIPTVSNDFGPDVLNKKAIEFITQKNSPPFFLYYSFTLPHLPRGAKSIDAYTTVPERNERGELTGKRSVGTLQSNVEYIDFLIKELIEALQKNKLLENTIIFFTSDNPTSGGKTGGKCQVVQEKGCRVPLIVYAPTIIKSQAPSENLITLADLYPTFCELGGAAIPKDYEIDGKTFVSLLLEKPYMERKWIFSYYEDKRMLRTKNWLLDGEGNYFRCEYIANTTESHFEKVKADDETKEFKEIKSYFDNILVGLPKPTEQFLKTNTVLSTPSSKQTKKPKKNPAKPAQKNIQVK
ncbi:MAG: sulfatase-like hydrolase/transferase [Sphingobacteriales bacterium]|nr:sulfatase-like hydrolase/transferase [Sphingobacteriales bacterium]